MNKSRKIIILTLLAALFVLSSTISYAVAPIQQAKIAAEHELPWLKGLIGDHYKGFDIQRAYLGEPIENYAIYDFDSNKGIEEQMEKVPFYVFPVMVDGKAVTDMPVMLQNEQWKVIDIGGHLSTIIQKAKISDKLADIKILRFFGEAFVLGSKNNKAVGLLPYNDNQELGTKQGKPVDIKLIKKAVEKRNKQLEEMPSTNDAGELLYLGTGPAPVVKSEFKQENVVNRLLKYIEHVL